MKIAQVVCTFPPYAGGIGQSAYEIGRLLEERHAVINFTPANLKPWLKLGHGAFLPQLLWKLRGFDYIYLHYPFFGAAEVVWLFKLLGGRAKLIVHYHMDVKNPGFIFKILSLPSRLIRRSLFNRAAVIVSASLDYVKHSRLKKYYAGHEKKFQEIPFGLDLKIFQPKLIDRPADNKIIARAQEIVHYINDKFIKKDRLNLLFVGGLDQAHYFKGIEILLLALAGLRSRNWQLTLVGEGDLRSTYEKTAEKLGLSRRVKFTGKLTGVELIRAFQNTDLLILPSINKNEAFGRVLIEALACGVPVIASNLPGVRRVFSDHQEGLLIEPGSVADLRKKLEFMFNNEKLRRIMALAARRLAEEKYDLESMKKKLEGLFA
jgi:glycosyltransferase involved in cell wall biosynthesis